MYDHSLEQICATCSLKWMQRGGGGVFIFFFGAGFSQKSDEFSHSATSVYTCFAWRFKRSKRATVGQSEASRCRRMLPNEAAYYCKYLVKLAYLLGPKVAQQQSFKNNPEHEHIMSLITLRLLLTLDVLAGWPL